MSSAAVGRRTSPLLMAFLLLPFAGQVAGYCSSGSGLVYEDKTSWRLHPCLTCSCNVSVVLCEEQQCPALVCDAGGKEEALTFLPSQCCPVCRRRFRGCRRQDGTTSEHGTKWSQGASCEECVCVDGASRCRALSCSELDCAPVAARPGLGNREPSAITAASGRGSGTAVIPERAECCSSCTPKAQCAAHGRHFKVGDTWQQSACVQCICREGGTVHCFAKECAPLPSHCRGQPFVPKGSCCPVCPELTCTDNGNLYQNGQLWRSGCSDCVCTEGLVKCDKISCQMQEYCPQASRLITVDDGCCQYCVPTDGTCDYEGALYYHGQQWNVSRCGFCTCTNGKIICQTAQCMAVEPGRDHTCLVGEHTSIEEGSCCPVCKQQRTCTNSQGSDPYMEGDTWFEGPCKMCTCRGAAAGAAAADCYLSSCYANRTFTSGGIIPGSSLEVMAGGRVSIPYANLISKQSRRQYRIRVQLLQGPTHGRLTTSNGALLAEQSSVEMSTSDTGLVYVHKAGGRAAGDSGADYRQPTAAATNDDYIVLHVFADKNSANHVIQVHVTVPVMPKITALMRNEMCASHGSMSSINSTVLAYAADGCEPSSLLFDITRVPMLGDVVVAVPIPPSGALPGWTADDTTSSKYRLMWLTTTTFRQVDIDEGRIYYRRRPGITQAPDSFEFDVGCTGSRHGSDGRGPESGRLEGQSMSIAVAPPKEATPDHRRTAVATAALLARATASPVLALENQTTPITAANLPQFVDDLTGGDLRRSGSLVYSVTRPLSNGQGSLEYADSPFQPISRFTQQDLIDRRLLYRPPLKDQGPVAKDVDFSFTVSLLESDLPAAGDGGRLAGTSGSGGDVDVDSDWANAPPQAEQSVAIRVVPVNNQPPRLRGAGGSSSDSERAAVVELMVHGGTGGSAALDQRLLDVSDVDSLPEQLFVTVKSLPTHGDLVKATGGDRLRVFLRLDDRFTYTEIMDGSIKYVHDGSQTMEDSISLKIDDGDHSLDVTVRVVVLVRAMETPAQPPSKAASACMMASVKEGETVTLLPSALEFTSPAQDAVVTLTLAGAPLYGTLKHSSRGPLSPGESVTQREIAAGLLSYAADDEVGYGDVADGVYFNVSDSTGGTLPLQLLRITVQACDDKPPYCVQHVPFKVDESGRSQLTGAHLDCHDVDTPPYELLVVVDTEPTFGILQTITDTATSPGSSSVRRTRVKAFTQPDLDRGHLYYNQTNHSLIEPRSDAFMFHVTDGTNVSPTIRFNITIEAQNDEPPTIITEQILVEEGKAIMLTTSSIFVTDIDSDETALVLTVETIPIFGLLQRKLEMDTESGPFTFGPGDTFRYKELQQGSVVYFHDGGETSTNDSLVLSVSDGKFSHSSTVSIVVALVDDETPRLSINNGLKVKRGMIATISREVLRATDIDSEDAALMFVITKPPLLGLIQWSSIAAAAVVAGAGSVFSRERQKLPQNGVRETQVMLSRFTQQHVDLGHIEYAHNGTMPGLADFFKFNVVDANNNTLLEQTFYIDVATDTSFPEIVRNTWLVVREKGMAKLTTEHLFVVDADADSDSLVFEVLESPRLGYLQIVGQRGGDSSITEFTLSELSAGKIAYVHNNTDEVTYVDTVIFSVSDGSNNIMLSFNIEVLPVDDSLPVLTISPLTVHEGTRRAVSEFEIKAADKDTKDELITFTVIRLPTHGQLELLGGSSSNASAGTVKILAVGTTFSMANVYASRLRYSHDSSEVAHDVFSLTVTDGTNDRFVLADGGEKRLMTAGTGVDVRVIVIAVDDGVPQLVRNKGIQHLQSNKGKVNCVIGEAELMAQDNDTAADRLVFKVTQPPMFGHLEKLNSAQDGLVLSQFTQADVNDRVVSYVLSTAPRKGLTADSFKFDILDTRPNVLRGNTFHIAWSTVSFEHDVIHIKEPDGVVHLPIIREGNVKEYSVVSCRSRPGSATVSASRYPGDSDYDGNTVQVHFESGQFMKTCDIRIFDDDLHEGPETFYVEIESPVNALAVTPARIQIVIDDLEDQPVLQFAVQGVEVKETDGFARIPIVRVGDASSAVWVMCVTQPLTATGSTGMHYTTGVDFESREEHGGSGSRRSAKVYLEEGVTNSSCSVRIIDDAVYEELEEFEVRLAHPSYNARLGAATAAVVRIAGPNDVSVISMHTESMSVGEDAGQAVVHITRIGVDLSMTSTVWCSTKLAAKPPAAEPMQDYLPLASKVTFEPQQTRASCTVKIVDDEESPLLEGTESFTVSLSAVAGGATLGERVETRVSIDDALQDAPRVQFEHEAYYVHESDRKVSATIRRTGDLRPESSVICYTRQRTAMAKEDFEERPLLNTSRVRFGPGQNAQNCTIHLVDDDHFESEEEFIIRLAQPLTPAPYSALLGMQETSRIVIDDADDEPTIQFDRPAYSVAEPSRQNLDDTFTSPTANLAVRIMRSGDPEPQASLRLSTRDGSAVSGLDYRASSRIVTFETGVRHLDVNVTVLENLETQWHLSFSVVLELLSGARLGHLTSAIVTILDNQEAATVIMPAAPLVISLVNYRPGAQSAYKDSPSAGHPLLCLHSCDPVHPAFSASAATACRKDAINGSATKYQWEVARGSGHTTSLASPRTAVESLLFVTLGDSTPFASPKHRVLESFYFRAGFYVRCTAQPVSKNGRLGVPLRSQPVLVTAARPVCPSLTNIAASATKVTDDGRPLAAVLPYGFAAQSFVVALRHLPASDAAHPNTMHVRVTVPHEDGMLPLVSTFPLRDVRLLMASAAYRQQHPCSNFVESAGQDATGSVPAIELPSGGARVEDLATQSARQPPAVAFYRHLDTRKCAWTFDAWYGISQLVDVCGGSATNAFDGESAAGTGYLTVRLPLYVSYLFAAGATGWTLLEQQTEAALTFEYVPSQLSAGVGRDDELLPPGGQLHVTKLSVDVDGRLVVEFRTVPNYRGLYVMHHSTLPGATSHVLPPATVPTDFELQLLTTQPTYDSPVQTWRARSLYSLQDYSGAYEIELVPCLVNAHQRYIAAAAGKIACTAQQATRFIVSISFRQPLRPVPVRYTLSAHFQLTSSPESFLADPRSANDDGDADEITTFSRGQLIYGRVFWDPLKDLGAAYRLTIQKVFVCSGSDGYVPTYDPAGDVYGKGQQYGCLQPSRKLRYRFLVLDQADRTDGQQTKTTDAADFRAVFARDSAELSALHRNYHGADGFRMSIDPLCEVTGDYRWYVQVLYAIEPSDGHSSDNIRRARSIAAAAIGQPRGGTNIMAFAVQDSSVAAARSSSGTAVRDSSSHSDGSTGSQHTSPTQWTGWPVAVTSAVAVTATVCVTVVLLIVRKQLPSCRTGLVRRTETATTGQLLHLSHTDGGRLEAASPPSAPTPPMQLADRASMVTGSVTALAGVPS